MFKKNCLPFAAVIKLMSLLLKHVQLRVHVWEILYFLDTVKTAHSDHVCLGQVNHYKSVLSIAKLFLFFSCRLASS